VRLVSPVAVAFGAGQCVAVEIVRLGVGDDQMIDWHWSSSQPS
jgi:hypothetical protein